MSHLTTQQLATFKTAILAETDPAFVISRNAGATGEMTDFYNAAHPTFIVWKTLVAITAIGDAFNGTELAGLTSANQTRLQTIAQFSPSGVNPSITDRRSFFDDVFSGAGGTTTRANLLALWKRAATRFERLYATGTGSDASPGVLVLQGKIGFNEVVEALAS